MKRREFLYGLGGAGVLSAGTLPRLALAAAAPARGVRVVVDEEGPTAVRDAAHRVAEEAGHPLLGAMGAVGKLEVVGSRKLLAGPLPERAYNHLILVGLPTDPMIAAAWQREARVVDGGLYVFGFGTLKGDLGYLESNRNVFLHSPGVSVAPFETEVVTISGATTVGVGLACDTFRTKHLVNGVVADKWSRPSMGLLDRNPLGTGFSAPTLASEKVAGFQRIGLTQAAEDEYRGVLADTGVSPMAIWRAKYFVPGAWDQAGAVSAMEAYSAGLHRRAYGNTRWIAEFASADEAGQAAPKIAGAAQLKRAGARWSGTQPYYADAKTLGSGNRGPLALWADGAFVLMSTVPND